MESPRPRFSLVIPAFNEQMYLPRLLDSVERARATYSGGAENVEVIVADNGSTDETATIASSRGCRVAQVEKRAIAASRNGGATWTDISAGQNWARYGCSITSLYALQSQLLITCDTTSRGTEVTTGTSTGRTACSTRGTWISRVTKSV